MDDKEIVALYLARSETAIRETERKYGRFCHAIAYGILQNQQDAEEVVNDTYLRLWRSIPPHEPDPLKPYIATVSRRLALDVYDEKHAQKRYGQVPVLLDELAECIPDGDSGGDIGESAALRDTLDRFLRALPPRTRRIFVRRYFYADSVAALAEDFHMKESAVTMLLLRTRKKLKNTLEKEGYSL